jgi:hypothetical protein
MHINNAEGRAYAAREMHLAIYGMLLVLTGLQPVEHLPWFEQGMVEEGAVEMDDHLLAA